MHRTELDQRLHFIVMLFNCLLCLLVFTVSSPPYSPVDPAATVDYTAAAYDYVVDDSTATVEVPGKQPFPSPTYRLLFYIYLLH